MYSLSLLYMLATTGVPAKRTSSAAELTSQGGFATKKPRSGDLPLERHQATLLSEAVDTNLAAPQPEPPAPSQAQMLQIAAKPPRGRRRFIADLEELKSAGYSLQNYRVNSTWMRLVFPCISTHPCLQSCALETKKVLSSSQS